MLRRTHIAIALAVALYFVPYVSQKLKLLFIPIVIVSTLLPDLDSGFSRIGRGVISKPIQMFTEHRGILHSYTLCLALSVLFAFFYPIVALPFFLGYSFHLFADSFTVRGIKPFWPLKFVASGNVNTGGKAEMAIFWVFVLIDVFMVVFLLF